MLTSIYEGNNQESLVILESFGLAVTFVVLLSKFPRDYLKLSIDLFVENRAMMAKSTRSSRVIVCSLAIFQ